MSGLPTLLVAGAGKEVTYATGVAASRYLPLKSESLVAKRSPILSEHATGGGAKEFVGEGLVDGGGPLEEIARYDLTTDPVNELLEQIFGKGRGHWYRKVKLAAASTTAWIPLRNGAASKVELAGQFTNAVLATATITVRLWLRRRGNPSGNVTVEIQTDSVGLPSGTAVTNGASNNINAASITNDDNGEMIEFTFAVDPSLAASTIYHIVLKGTYAPSATDHIQALTEVVGSGGNFEIKDVSYADDVTSNLVGQGLTTTFIDSYIMKDTVEGLGTSIALDKQTKVHQFIGVKPKSVKITSKPKEGMLYAYDTILNSEQAAATTTAAQLAGLKNDRTKPLHSDLTCSIASTAAAIVAGDAIKPDSVEFSLARPLDQEYVSGQDTALEPLENGRRDVMITLTFPRYAATTWQTWYANKTTLQGHLQWTAGGKYKSLLLPVCKIDGEPEVPTDAAGKPYGIKVTLRFLGNRGSLANLFMPIYGECEFNALAA